MTDPTPSCPQTNPTDNMPPTRTSNISPNLLHSIFTSLTHPSRRWSLLRTLQSDNPCDITGELRGTATFHPLQHTPTASASDRRDVVYREEGELPTTFGAGLRWTKKYIWRQGENGGISVWFVKVKPSVKPPQARTQEQEEDDETDYLFHNFDFEGQQQDGAETETEMVNKDNKESMFVSPPVPPLAPGAEDTAVIMARGNHLCINDMYRTAYAFRVRPDSGEVVSWSSRHVVKGPKKNQDIVNLYRMEG